MGNQTELVKILQITYFIMIPLLAVPGCEMLFGPPCGPEHFLEKKHKIHINPGDTLTYISDSDTQLFYISLLDSGWFHIHKLVQSFQIAGLFMNLRSSEFALWVTHPVKTP